MLTSFLHCFLRKHCFWDTTVPFICRLHFCLRLFLTAKISKTTWTDHLSVSSDILQLQQKHITQYSENIKSKGPNVINMWHRKDLIRELISETSTFSLVRKYRWDFGTIFFFFCARFDGEPQAVLGPGVRKDYYSWVWRWMACQIMLPKYQLCVRVCVVRNYPPSLHYSHFYYITCLFLILLMQ